jgi:hypothetical protein
MSGHRLIVDQRVIQRDFDTAKDVKYSLFYQLTRITRDRGALVHDDRLDALAIAVNYWVESMARDNNKAAADIKGMAIDRELKKFMGGILGMKPKGNSWITRA